jgi:adenosine deaminase
MMSGVTLTDEYAHAAASLGFTKAELAKIAINGFESAFLSWEERESLVARARRDVAALGT